jgi:type I restriction enzyme S subunit
MAGLPSNWTQVVLNEIIDAYQAGFASGKKDVQNGLAHLRMNNIGIDGSINLDLLRKVPASLANENHILSRNDILFCTTNSAKLVGKCALFTLDGKFAFSNHLTRIRCNDKATNSHYLQKYLFSLWTRGEFEDKCKHWVNQSTLPKEQLLSTPIFLPPLPEQHRIVAKLEKLLHKVDACKERLEKIPTILKRFRQSILSAACSGRLTADWRMENLPSPGAARHPLPEGEGNHVLPLPAEVSGVERKLREDRGEGGDLPEGWNITCINKLASYITSGSRGWAQYYADSGSIFIRAQNINSDFLDLSDVAYVNLPNKAEGLRTRVQLDDLLVTITGANVTKSARVIDRLDDAYVSQHVALVRLKDVRLSKFLFLVLVSPAHGRAQLLDAAYGQGKPGLNLENIRDVSVPLPTFPEQQEIVRRVEALFAIAARIEERYQKARVQVDKLTQSILAKAFRGELVPQDPDDEPASVLLERIRAEKGKIAPAGRRTGLRKTSRPPKRKPVPTAASPTSETLPADVSSVILYQMQPGQEYSRADIIDRLALSSYEWNRAIMELKESGRIIQTGERRGARYRLGA